MNHLPKDWDLVSFADLGQWYGGGTPSKSNPAYWRDGTLPWLSPKDMGDDVLSGTLDQINPSAVAETSVKLVPAGSVAVVVRSGILERTLPVALVTFVTTLNQDMKAVVPRAGIMPEWIAWGLRAGGTDLLTRVRKAGTTVASIEMSKFFAQTLPVPPLEEQQRIVTLLEDHLTRLDVANASLAKARLLANSLIKAAVLATIPSPLPSHWTQSTVAEVGDSRLGRQRHPDWHTGPNMRPYLRVANVFEDRIDSSDVMEMDFSGCFEEFRLLAGDVLLNEGQSPHLLGRPAIYRGVPEEVAFTNSLIRFRPGPSVLSEWALLVFRHHMHSRRFMRESRITTNIAHLSLKRLLTVEFPVPPLEEQRQIVERLRQDLDEIERLSNDVRRRLAQASLLRRSLLASAFTGQLAKERSLV